MAFSGDTEFFNGSGFRRVDRIRPGERVLAFRENGEFELVVPRVQLVGLEESICEASSSLLDFCFTEKQNIVWWDAKGKCWNKISFETVIRDGTFSGLIPCSCVYPGSRHLEEPEIEGILSVFEEDREISEENSALLYNADLVTRRHLLDRLFLFSNRWITSNKDNVDLVSSVLQMSGHIIKRSDNGSKYGVTWVSRLESPKIWFAKCCGDYERMKIKRVEYRPMWEFHVPSGMLVLRRNGKLFITGDC